MNREESDNVRQLIADRDKLARETEKADIVSYLSAFFPVTCRDAIDAIKANKHRDEAQPKREAVRNLEVLVGGRPGGFCVVGPNCLTCGCLMVDGYCPNANCG